jgi:hypothetical protein
MFLLGSVYFERHRCKTESTRIQRTDEMHKKIVSSCKKIYNNYYCSLLYTADEKKYAYIKLLLENKYFIIVFIPSVMFGRFHNANNR